MTRNTRAKPASMPGPDLAFPELLEPVAREKPCGDDLEYDPEFVLLMARAAPKAEAQYGNFVSEPEAVNWADLERDCRRLLLRTRDIRILVLWLRCRTRPGMASGLRDGLATLACMLAKWPDEIHPQLLVDGEADPAMRANALAALTDPEGLMRDIRELVITGNAALRLQIRDVERSLGMPRPADALAPESVRLQLQALRQQNSPALAALDQAAGHAAAIDRWAKANLRENGPDLSPLLKLLGMLTTSVATAPAPPAAAAAAAARACVSADCPSDKGAAGSPCASAAAVHPDKPEDRDAALAGIRGARDWFERHEPSSPVSLLLRQAERLAGKRFDEVFQAIPAELVARWSQDI
ncbi:replication/virulence associated protein; ImpA-related N-terminal domain [Cupriavidus taiwanensis LMG 19424]|uniref:Replication/virulence associated protein ImpA-related N-terminal domain n=1 Tax=Cupriavidus taiwanensis (strain DSM 17343 / BCRC 17206 / CCUG 44338 / CIP 107171 / LMG 19424 / R1) TaxID=977880 RepID=B3R0Z7_CUPTR|nr:replication/virulence associated protein; ImpA-related N-terminal domain [Cupriavidus taiwanensis LMG 19424]